MITHHIKPCIYYYIKQQKEKWLKILEKMNLPCLDDSSSELLSSRCLFVPCSGADATSPLLFIVAETEKRLPNLTLCLTDKVQLQKKKLCRLWKS